MLAVAMLILPRTRTLPFQKRSTHYGKARGGISIRLPPRLSRELRDASENLLKEFPHRLDPGCRKLGTMI